jgi:hypothetical protein
LAPLTVIAHVRNKQLEEAKTAKNDQQQGERTAHKEQNAEKLAAWEVEIKVLRP